MDLHENTQTNTVTATFELPGLTKENVQIDVHNGVLRVSGESKISSDRDANGFAVRERRYGKFSRSIPVPQGIKVGIRSVGIDKFDANVSFNRAKRSKPPWRMAYWP